MLPIIHASLELAPEDRIFAENRQRRHRLAQLADEILKTLLRRLAAQPLFNARDIQLQNHRARRHLRELPEKIRQKEFLHHLHIERDVLALFPQLLDARAQPLTSLKDQRLGDEEKPQVLGLLLL